VLHEKWSHHCSHSGKGSYGEDRWVLSPDKDGTLVVSEARRPVPGFRGIMFTLFPSLWTGSNVFQRLETLRYRAERASDTEKTLVVET
jgi:hypothetical protein